MVSQLQSPASGRFGLGLMLLPLCLLLYYFKDAVARFVVFEMLQFPHTAAWALTLLHFISTSLKIFLLLYIFMFTMALVRTWFPMEKIRAWLESLPVFPATVAAGFFGVLTPFCSCSAVPLFISFLESGFPLGMTFTFLIASPLVNEVIIIMLAGLFGFRIALIYAVAGLIIAIAAGLLIDRLKLEKYLPPWLLDFHNRKRYDMQAFPMSSRFVEAGRMVRDSMRRIWVYALAGIAVSSLIHGYVPETWLARFADGSHWYALPLALTAGLPLYACSASVAPVAFSLVDKGLPVGVALVFVMAVAGLSLPELIMLRKVLSWRLLLIFTGIVFSGILAVGTLFYILL